MLQQISDVNLGGIVTINPETRVASITVEIYRTDDNTVVEEFHLSVAMLQDNILGSQVGMASNPDQIIDGQYNHMHAFRDMITDAWGDEIIMASGQSLVTKTYEYEIPETIGSPNGVEAVLEDLSFLVWIAEGERQIITANELLTFITGNTGPIAPVMTNFAQVGGVLSCDEVKDASFSIINIGTEALTEIKYEIEVNGQTDSFVWEGTIASFEGAQIPLQVTIPDGKHTVKLILIEANGQALDPDVNTKEAEFEGSSWIEAPEKTNALVIKVRQDRYGNQTTWELLKSDLTVIASGGPYDIIPAGQTKLHVETVELTEDDCMKFIIRDSGGNGINNGNGEGNYQIEDAQGNIIFAGDGVFESEEATLFSITKPTGLNGNEVSKIKTYPNPVKQVLNITGIDNLSGIVIYNIQGQLVLQTKEHANTIDVSTLPKGIYFVRMNIEGAVVNRKIVKE